jgi:hypothetical protein
VVREVKHCVKPEALARNDVDSLVQHEKCRVEGADPKHRFAKERRIKSVYGYLHKRVEADEENQNLQTGTAGIGGEGFCQFAVLAEHGEADDIRDEHGEQDDEHS